MEKKDRIKKDISRESYLQTVIRRFKQHHLATVSLVILAVLVVAAFLAPIIAPYNPDEIVGGFSKAPTAEHWLGTDQIGRDVLSRLLYATRISLLVGVLATAISTVIGVILGLIAGYFGGAAESAEQQPGRGILPRHPGAAGRHDPGAAAPQGGQPRADAAGERPRAICQCQRSAGSLGRGRSRGRGPVCAGKGV